MAQSTIAVRKIAELPFTMKPSVLVIGGGAAGVTATLRLGHHGFPVTLLEERRRLGGRLVDHPLVLFGWHRETLNLVDFLGTRPSIQFSPDYS